MGQRKTYRSELTACALEQHGYVTADDALRLGIPGDLLDRLLERGDLVSVSGGLFRLDGVPRSRAHVLAEAVLRVGRGAYLSHDAVLALHELTGHEPSPVRIGTPCASPPWGPGPAPDDLEVHHRDLPPEDLTTYHGIRSATVARALLDSRGLLPRPVLASAAAHAVRRGLLLRRERHAVLEALDAG